MPNYNDAFNRGLYDAKKDRAPIFRNQGGFIAPTSEDPQSDDWSEEARAAYLAGYDEGEALEWAFDLNYAERMGR